MKRKVCWRGGACLLAAVVLAGCGEDAPPPTIPQTPPEGAVVTQGIAAESFACGNLARECSGSTRFVEARCGFVQAPNGERRQVPAVPAEGPDPTDLYNSCRGEGDSPDYLDELQTVVVDEDGEEVTGYLFGDNYFELYVNGKIVARDPIGFVPFNSAVVRFRAKAPLVFAVKLVDWGTHLGVGMEYDRWNVGDGGFVARFGDGTETNAAWKCRAFYMSPLQDVSCVAPGPDTSACPEDPPCVDDDPATCLALHYSVPDDWADADFDDADWPAASTYSAREVTGNRAYHDYKEKFGAAQFVWSRNLDQDNLVLCRSPASTAQGA